jgi:DnaJ-class molecular chaperone
MVFKILLEELSAENTKRFRKLMHKFHPDKGGDKKLAQEILSAKSKSDDEQVKRLFDKHFGEEKKKESPSLSDYSKWAEELENKYDIMSLVRRMEEDLGLASKGDIRVEFFIKGVKGYGNRSIMWDAIKYKDKKSFTEAAEKLLKKDGII